MSVGRKRAEDNGIRRRQDWDAEKIENDRRRKLFAEFITELDHYNAARIKAVYDPVRKFLRVQLVRWVDEPGPRPQGGGGAAPA